MRKRGEPKIDEFAGEWAGTVKRNQRIFFLPERCLGCFSCRLACQMQALGVSGVEEIPVGRKPPERIAFTMQRGTPWVWSCRHCLSAPCVEACISGSLRHEGGKIAHSPEQCVGCGSCALACPFEAIRPLEDREAMVKCDLCEEEPHPPCVTACLSGALVVMEPGALARMKRKSFVLETRRSDARKGK